MFLKIAGFILIAAGALVTFSARSIASRFGLDKKFNDKKFKVKVQEPEKKGILRDEIGIESGDSLFDEENTEHEEYLFDKAILNVKMSGMFLLLPGIVIILLTYR